MLVKDYTYLPTYSVLDRKFEKAQVSLENADAKKSYSQLEANSKIGRAHV